MLDWQSIWHWITNNWDKLLELLASFARNVPIWVIGIIAGYLAFEGIRRFIQALRLRRHVQKYERAEIEQRLGVVEKPRWERKKNKEIKIGDRIYHPVQQDPGGIWLQIASSPEDVQNQVILVNDVQSLVHNSVKFHNNQHKRQAINTAALGIAFLAVGIFVVFAYYMLKL
jgi:beta-lactamase regulating signal transducer with metallopeptidase domain